MRLYWAGGLSGPWGTHRTERPAVRRLQHHGVGRNGLHPHLHHGQRALPGVAGGASGGAAIHHGFSVLCRCFRFGSRQGSVISRTSPFFSTLIPCMTAAEVRYSSFLMFQADFFRGWGSVRGHPRRVRQRNPDQSHPVRAGGGGVQLSAGSGRLKWM